ncbi:hypothetical protein Tco_0987363, partial [Tanacetum coccineum]
KESWGDSEDEDDTDDDGDNDDDGESDDHDDDSDDERTESDSDEIPNLNLTNVDQTEYEEEDIDDRVRTPSDYELTNEEKLDDEETMDDEKDDGVIKELYDDVNVNLGNDDTKMTDDDQGASEQQNVSQESGFNKLLNLENPSPADNKIASLMETSARHTIVIPKITSGFTTTTPPPPLFFNPILQQQTPAFTTTTSTYLTMTLPEISNFASTFKFDQRVSALESEISELRQTNQFAKAVSLISGIVDTYLASKIKEVVNVVVQLQPNKLREEAQAKNQEFLNQIEKYVTKSLGAEVLVRSTNQPQTAYIVAASLSEFELKKILIDKMEANKSINRSDNQKNLYNALVESYNSNKDILTSYGDVVLLKIGRDDQDKDEDPSAGSDRGTKRRKSGKDTESSKDSRSKEKKSSSTSKDASQSQHMSSVKFVHAEEPSHTVEDSCMQQDQEFVTRDNDEQPADKEVTKADWFKKPEKPPTPDPYWSKRQQVDFRPPQTWISQAALAEEPPASFDEFNDTSFDFSAFVLNRLKILNLTQEILDYGHLEEIKVRRDDQQLYTFKEGDFKRLRLQDIEDMLLILVQEKLTNLTIDERYDLNVAMCMFTRRIVIQRRVEDLQLGVESYQKKLNLTKFNTYRPNIRNKTAYTSHSDPHGIIYVDQFKRKRLMHTDELHKFSDGTLNDVRTALHDITTGIRMEYLPMRKWSNLDKKRAQVMVQDIDKQLYQRRLMWNLEMFVGGRIYGKDLRLLERTI